MIDKHPSIVSADSFCLSPSQPQQLGLPGQPNFEAIQMRPGKEPFVLEHADDNARSYSLLVGECCDVVRAAR